VVEEIWAELSQRAETAIDETLAGLPGDFKEWSLAHAKVKRLLSVAWHSTIRRSLA
jgi:hypothetical protein